MSIDEKIEACKSKLEGYKKVLAMMPEDTILGRICMVSYIRREEARLERLEKEKIEMQKKGICPTSKTEAEAAIPQLKKEIQEG